MNAMEVTSKVLERFDLNKKLLLSFILTAITIISLISFISINRSEDALKTEIGINFQHQASSAMEKIDACLFERYGDVQAFASNNLAIQKLQGNDVEESFQNYINKMVVLYGYYDLMILVDIQGKIIKTNIVKPDGSEFFDSAYLIWKDESQSDWFKKCTSGKIKKGESYYSEPYFDEDLIRFYKSKVPSMIFAAPVYDKDNKIIGVWANYVNTRKVMSTITSNMITQNKKKGINTFQVLIVDKNQKIIDDMQKPADILVFNFKHKLQSINKAVAGVDSFMVEKNVRAGYIQINGFALSKGQGDYKGDGWACMTRVQTAEAFAPIRNLTYLLVIVGVVLLVLVAIITFLFAKFMIYDIGRFGNFLNNTTKDIVNGKLDTRGDPKLVGIDFRILVEHTNMLIDSFVKPINITAEYVDRISKG
ncbi:MAG: hypothetical protein NTW25_01280, partial [Candidatus Kapabacteria bacterium]|nr:hypothetical protein [Candidatus Kapabacteria bacterium]